MPVNVLIFDPAERRSELLCGVLRGVGHRVSAVARVGDAVARLGTPLFDLVVFSDAGAYMEAFRDVDVPLGGAVVIEGDRMVVVGPEGSIVRSGPFGLGALLARAREVAGMAYAGDLSDARVVAGAAELDCRAVVRGAAAWLVATEESREGFERIVAEAQSPLKIRFRRGGEEFDAVAEVRFVDRSVRRGVRGVAVVWQPARAG
jgi:hypothetical protein